MRRSPSGNMWFFTEPEWEVVRTMKRAAAADFVFEGREDQFPMITRHTADHVPSGTRLLYTRDAGHHTSGWFKNPDFERCLHLSLSYRDRETGSPEPQRMKQSLEWAKLFFGADYKLAWSEPPHSPEGKKMEVWHFRLFCDANWQPIKPRGEVYSTEFTEKGWLSCSELGNAVISSLNPG